MGSIVGLTALRFPHITTWADDRVPESTDRGRLLIRQLFLLDHGINASRPRRNFAQLVRAGNSNWTACAIVSAGICSDSSHHHAKFAGNRSASPTLIPATKTPNATIQQPWRSEDVAKNLAAVFRYRKVGELWQDWQNE